MSPRSDRKQSRQAEQPQQPSPFLPPVPPDQLMAMQATEIGAMILPLWAGGDGIPRQIKDGEIAPNTIESMWTGTSAPALFRPFQPFSSPLAQAIAEGIQALEHAGLLLRSFSSESGTVLHLTRLGAQALTQGTVLRYLGLPG